MAKANETIAEIIAEMRERAEAMQTHGTTHGVKLAVREFANRIEAAWKRERDRLMSEPRSWEECVERAMKVKENSDVLY